tara:strand:+ start:2246 stop:2506 length:261 start_codon:yes stop_codon:yes gene_type:complete
MNNHLTPFEKMNEGLKNQAIITGVLIAIKDIIDVCEECNIQINSASSSPNSEEQEIIDQATIDSYIAEQAIIALADNLEEKFGISA